MMHLQMDKVQWHWDQSNTYTTKREQWKLPPHNATWKPTTRVSIEKKLHSRHHQAELCQNCLLHNTFHVNFTDHFQNWSLQLTLKITWSLLPNLKLWLLKIELCSKMACFISRQSRPFQFSYFDLLISIGVHL